MRRHYALYSAAYQGSLEKITEKKQNSHNWRKAMDAMDERVISFLLFPLASSFPPPATRLISPSSLLSPSLSLLAHPP
jgi:hypothetical protein